MIGVVRDTGPAHTSRAPRPLEGIRVLDLTRVLSGPHATRMLADLGAEVIKIEPPDGDLTRFASPKVGSFSTYFIQQNAGKRNLSLDLSTPEGAEILLGLAEVSDVLIENFRPGVMDRLGLGPDRVRQRVPRLIYASISGYGATGPWTHRRAYAPVVGAEAGMTRIQGDARGGEITNDPHSHADVYTAMESAAGILAALYLRERTGQGQWIDMSMADTLLYVNEHVHDQLFDGEVRPEWIRSFQPGDYPVLTVADGSVVVISGHPAERGTFDRFVAAMHRPDLLEDPRFADVATRLAHLEDLAAILTDWAAAIPDAEELEARLATQGLAAGRVRSVRELADSDWARERGSITTVEDGRGGELRVPAPPWRFSDASTGSDRRPRYRGEDNRAVLAEILGLDAATIEDYEHRGILSSRPPR